MSCELGLSAAEVMAVTVVFGSGASRLLRSGGGISKNYKIYCYLLSEIEVGNINTVLL